jgi:hypothetical protein
MATPAPPEDQARLLEDALIAVRQQTVMMRKCLDTPGKLMDALKCWCVQFPFPASPVRACRDVNSLARTSER